MAKPSEIFLALWYHRTQHGIDKEDFCDCADAWLQIQELETMCTSKPAFEEMFPMFQEKKREPEREIQIDQHTFEVVSDPEKTDTSSVAAATETSEERHTLPARRDSPQGGAQEPKPKNNRDRKREIRDRIIEARKNGINTQAIANASGGKVTDTTIYQIINAETVDIRTYERIALGLDKLGA